MNANGQDCFWVTNMYMVALDSEPSLFSLKKTFQFTLTSLHLVVRCPMRRHVLWSSRDVRHWAAQALVGWNLLQKGLGKSDYQKGIPSKHNSTVQTKSNSFPYAPWRSPGGHFLHSCVVQPYQ
jgi:hypothetical protein